MTFRRAAATLAALPVLLYGIVTAENTIGQTSMGQHKLQKAVATDIHLAVKAANQRRLTTGVYETSVYGNPPSSYEEMYMPAMLELYVLGISSYLKEAFQPLGIQVDSYHRRDSISEEVSRNAGFLAAIESYSKDARTNPYSKHTLDIMLTSLNSKPFVNKMRRREDISVVLVELDGGGGLYLPDSRIALVNHKRRGEILWSNESAQTITHEVAHALGIGHAAVIPDAMSYSNFIRPLLMDYPSALFGLESKLEWAITRDRYDWTTR